MILYIAVNAIENRNGIGGAGYLIAARDTHGTLCFFYFGGRLHGVLAIVNRHVLPWRLGYPAFRLLPDVSRGTSRG